MFHLIMVKDSSSATRKISFTKAEIDFNLESRRKAEISIYKNGTISGTLVTSNNTAENEHIKACRETENEGDGGLGGRGTDMIK